jgi:PhnB protein
MDIVSYIWFDGHAEEALDFYQRALGAEVEAIHRYKDSPEPGYFAAVSECRQPGAALQDILLAALRHGADRSACPGWCMSGRRTDRRTGGSSLTVTGAVSSRPPLGAIIDDGIDAIWIIAMHKVATSTVRHDQAAATNRQPQRGLYKSAHKVFRS